MTAWRWTCRECAATGVILEVADVIHNEATRHSSSHAKGPFDLVAPLGIEEAVDA